MRRLTLVDTFRQFIKPLFTERGSYFQFRNTQLPYIWPKSYTSDQKLKRTNCLKYGFSGVAIYFNNLYLLLVESKRIANPRSVGSVKYLRIAEVAGSNLRLGQYDSRSDRFHSSLTAVHC